MEALPTSASIRRLPQVLAATLGVVGLPVLAASLLRSSGAVTSPLLLVVSGIALSIVASYAGVALWMTRAGGGDTLFGDLMLWGWLRRWRMERLLVSAARLLGLRSSSADPSVELSLKQRARLLERLARALEARSPGTNGHSRRVARHAVAVAKRMGLPREQVARIRTAAAVHDVGKIETPAEILGKPGPLTDEELAVAKRHAAVGARMVEELGDPELVRIVRHHHERLDGTGYPDGLAGDRIPIGARVVAVADTFDAITSTRPYRRARSHKEALALLADVSGTQLDPDAVHAFRSYYSGFRPVALWALLLNAPRLLLASLGGELRLGSLALAKATAATAVTIATGGVAAHALHTNGPSSGAGASARVESRPAATPAGNDIGRLSHPSSGLADAHSSHKRGGETGSNGTAATGPVATSQGKASSGSQPEAGDSSPPPIAPDLPSSDGGPQVTVPDIPTPTDPVSSVGATVGKAVDSLPALPVQVPSVLGQK